MSRRQLGERLRALGFAIDDEELQTTGDVASRVLAGKRVLALTMPGHPRRPDGHAADRDERRRRARRRRRRDRGAGPDLLLPQPQPRLPRAARRRGALLPAQEPLVADGRGAAARRGRDRRRARVRLRDRGDRARQAEPGVLPAPRSRRSTPTPSSRGSSATTSRATSSARRRSGMRTVLVRTGKFRPDDLEHASVSPDGIVSSIAQLPDWLESEPLTRDARRRRPDRDRRASAARSSVTATASASAASPRPNGRTATRSRTRRSTTQAGSPRRRRSGRRSAPACTSRGARSRSAAGPKPGVHLSGATAAFAERVGPGAIELSMTHSRELAAPCRGDARMSDLIPLTTADETRRARRRYRGSLDELMERAGTAVARARRSSAIPGRVAVVCGSGTTAATAASARACCASAAARST